MKTKQAMAKRFIKTRKGTILKRKSGQSHFNARDRGATTMGKRRDVSVAKVQQKAIAKFLRINS